jgi:hypothetical protein
MTAKTISKYRSLYCEILKLKLDSVWTSITPIFHVCRQHFNINSIILHFYDKMLKIIYTTPNSCYIFTPFVYKGKALLNELKIRPGPAVGTLMDFQVIVTTLTILKVFCFYLD